MTSHSTALFSTALSVVTRLLMVLEASPAFSLPDRQLWISQAVMSDSFLL